MKKKTGKKPPKCDELLFEMEGKVWIVEKYKNKETSRSEIEPKIVLQAIINCLEYALNKVEAKLPKVEKKNVKRSKME